MSPDTAQTPNVDASAAFCLTDPFLGRHMLGHDFSFSYNLFVFCAFQRFCREGRLIYPWPAAVKAMVEICRNRAAIGARFRHIATPGLAEQKSKRHDAGHKKAVVYYGFTSGLIRNRTMSIFCFA